MYKVKTVIDVNGIGWGLDFKHGVAFTDREDLARRLKSLGYEVEDMTQKPVKPSTSARASEAPDAPPEAPTVPTVPIESGTASNEAPGDSDKEGASASGAPGANAAAATEKLKCPICGKECGSQAVLTRHTNKEHG
ncbi:MAG TPA: hypothetical protein VN538_12635 [Clostridia bacterium]|nr:hypothetical protein [Clostridia bacterium]